MDNVFYIINDNKVELSNGKEYSLVDFIDILVNYINQLETNRDEVLTLLEYYLIGNMKYRDSQEQFKRLKTTLERGKE